MGIFDVIIESSVIGFRKPNPKFYLLACEQLDIDPSEAVFLDDLGVNLKPARELGMTTIKVVDVASTLEELESILAMKLT
jgi:putative hydrolase of the HAD superfamily